MVAHNPLAHKLARAAYYDLRDNVAFEAASSFKRPAGTGNQRAWLVPQKIEWITVPPDMIS